ncbi:hypothetical protein FACS1894208_05170 [Clostridia bacterium]|nr:hypothetical protein FACS1894208_05170 [Clostridia bacterium]
MPSEIRIDDELRHITVFDVENAKTDSVSEEQPDENQDPVPKTVTLIVTEEQALKLVEAEYTGKIHLIFERRGK